MTVDAGPATVRGTGDIVCEPVRTAAALDAHFAIRRVVFVDEQQLFRASDVDERDHRPDTMHVLGSYRGEPAGAVRLFPTEPGGHLWQGDRLAVLTSFRSKGIGGPLVRCATRSAAERDGVEMLAHIQLANVRFFEHLGWRRDGDVETYVGVPHQPMRIDLTSLRPDGTGSATSPSVAGAHAGPM